MTVFAALVVAAAAALHAGQTMTEDQQRELRSTITDRFDVIPITDGIALRPKERLSDVRLIEITNGEISVNGDPVTARELRDRVGAAADAIVRLSFLDAAERKALFAPPSPDVVNPPSETPLEPVTPPKPPRERTISRRSSGDRVQVFGNVAVDEGESVGGQAIAVLGSVKVDGEVGQQVVAVLGSVDLGPNAVVGGDVVSVGGRVHRSPGAQVRGSITQVALGGGDIHVHPGFRIGMLPFFDGFGAVPRLIGSGFRLLLLMLLSALALVVARPTVEASAQRIADDPLKVTIVGIAAQILVLPILIIVCILLAITIIGIPILFLMMPFVILLLIVMAILGFSGAAYAVGQWTRRRFAGGAGGGLPDVVTGVFVILLPLLVGRLIAVAGWPVSGIALILIVAGIAFEYVMWTSGFGAVLTNAFSRWQARRAARLAPPPPAVP
jgi:hypothetical protein